MSSSAPILKVIVIHGNEEFYYVYNGVSLVKRDYFTHNNVLSITVHSSFKSLEEL